MTSASPQPVEGSIAVASGGVLGAEVEVIGLTKRFGGVPAVDDLTFTVTPGRVTGFLGPNGAGKTTTLRCLLGLVARRRAAPRSGATSITTYRRRCASWDPRSKRLDSTLDAAHATTYGCSLSRVGSIRVAQMRPRAHIVLQDDGSLIVDNVDAPVVGRAALTAQVELHELRAATSDLE